MTDPGPTLTQLQNSVFGKTRDQVEQELRAARTLINRALRNFDDLTPGAVISLAMAAQQVQLCADDIERRRTHAAPAKPLLHAV